MGFVSSVMGFFGFGIGITIGLVIGYYLFIYFQPRDAKDPVIRPFVEQDSQTLQRLLPEIPLWVKNPAFDRVDWLNKFIETMWPYLDKPHVDFGLKLLGAGAMSVPGLYRFVQNRDPRWEEEFQFMLEERPTNDRIHVEVVSTSSRMGLLHPKEALGYLDINLLDVVANKRINERYHLIDLKNGRVQI